MALNVKVFYTRLGSAILFSIVMMACVLWTEWAFMALFLLVTFLCLKEYAFLVENILQTTFSGNEKMNFILAGVASYLLVCCIPMGNCDHIVASFMQQYLYYFLGIVLGSMLLFFAFKKNKNAIYLWTGLGYISLSLGLLVQLRYQSLLLPLALILFIWMNDTLAYLTGSFFGKTPLFPAISPKKTLEGTIGGALFTMVFAFIWGNYTNFFPVAHWIVLGLIASVVGTAGDLVESKLKRLANVKDSGAIMPGHGGALDRFDSLLLSAPFAFLFALLWMKCLEIHVL